MGNIIWTDTMAKIASALILLGFILYSLYSGFIYIFFRDKYKGIKFTTKNITNIAMLSAASVTMTVVVAYYAPITVLPPVRVSFEGLMIKITGFIFGPIVGFISGLITDMFCILFIPSYFHIAYTITIVAYGFVSGMVFVINRCIVYKKYWIFIISNFLVIFYVSFFSYWTIKNPESMISIYGQLKVNKYTLVVILLTSGLVTIIFQWTVFLFYLRYKRKNKSTFLNTSSAFDNARLQKKPLIDESIIPILFMAIFTEYYVSGLISPWGDASLFGTPGGDVNSTYGAMLIYRILEAPIKIFFNTLIIYITYRTVSPLIDRDV